MAAPVIHRDLKPSNIIVSGANYTPDTGMTFSSLVIIDLGIARVWREGADADTVKFGTRPYAPPEQYGFGQTSVRSDVYALGALLFFCLTGADPKPGRNMREQCEAYDIPASLADVICMAMALDPDKRFASAKALGHAARASYALSAPTPSSAPNAASFQEPPEWRAVCPAPVLPTDQSQADCRWCLSARIYSPAFPTPLGAFGTHSSIFRYLFSLPEAILPFFILRAPTKTTRCGFSRLSILSSSTVS